MRDQQPGVVDAWLAATGLAGDEVVEIDGTRPPLRDALTHAYDICRVTPDLLGSSPACGREAATMLRAPSDREQWLARTVSPKFT